MPADQYHSSHDRLDFPHQGGKEFLEVYMWTCELEICNSSCRTCYIHTGQGTGHTSWWSLSYNPVASTVRVSTPGEHHSTMSRQLGLEPRTGSIWASPEVTCIQCGFGEYGEPYCTSEVSHILGTGCQLIISTPPYWAAFPYGMWSIWSVGFRDWTHNVSTRHGLDHSVDWGLPGIPLSDQGYGMA